MILLYYQIRTFYFRIKASIPEGMYVGNRMKTTIKLIVPNPAANPKTCFVFSHSAFLLISFFIDSQ